MADMAEGQLGSGTKKDQRLDLARPEIATTALFPWVEALPEELPLQLDAVEDGVVVVELELDDDAGLGRILRLENEVAADLHPLEHQRTPAASVRQGKTGELAKPVGAVAKQLVKDVVGVQTDAS